MQRRTFFLLALAWMGFILVLTFTDDSHSSGEPAPQQVTAAVPSAPYDSSDITMKRVVLEREQKARNDAIFYAELKRQDDTKRAAQSRLPRAPRNTPSSSPVYSDEGGLPAGLVCIRQKESGGNYADATGNGYYGAYQYSKSTWNGYGGYTYASDAPPSIQDERALSDYNKGVGQIHQNWPQTSRACNL